MAAWVRFNRDGETGFGTLADGQIAVYEGDMFGTNSPTGNVVALADVELLTPCQPTKVLGLWNNFNATAQKSDLPNPEHPWYFVMTPNTFANPNTTIHKPSACEGKILYEGELGIVIGKKCKNVAVEDIDDYILGYTCVNDVTALEFLFAEEKFTHWTRAKCFDGFCIFGPAIQTGVDPAGLSIKTFLEGDGQVQERQNYPVSDMIYSPRELVSRISYDMTLEPGDIIACGTSVGAGAMKDGWNVRISIEGVGELVNDYSVEPAQG
jgi:2-keto-4-pentenoate hydratase/2-oxohepta-3-ene-1,7-dioic acid hydratase in catechol pathway